MKVLSLIIYALTPILLIALFIYHKDKNKEPNSIIIKLLFGGILSTFITVFITIILGQIFDIFIEDFNNLKGLKLIIHAFICIALIEETSKYLMLNKISKNKECDEDFDMILYGSFIGLGFAAFENILYVVEYDTKVAIIRAFTAVPMHTILGIIMGYYLLKYKNTSNNKYKYLSIIIPVLIHGVYDYLIMTKIEINVILAIILLIIVFVYGIVIINKISKKSIKNNNNIYNEAYCPICGTKYELNSCINCGRERR